MKRYIVVCREYTLNPRASDRSTVQALQLTTARASQEQPLVTT